MGKKFGKDQETYSLRIHSAAQKNIERIYEHIAYDEHQPSNALKVFGAMRKILGKIKLNPYAFKEAEALPNSEQNLPQG